MSVDPPCRLTTKPLVGAIDLGRRNQTVRKSIEAARKGDEVEMVIVVEVANDESRCVDCLFELLALHRPGTVENEYDVFGDRLIGRDVDTGRDKEQEVAVLVTLPEGEQVRTDGGVGCGVEEHEVVAVDGVAALVAGCEVVVVWPIQRECRVKANTPPAARRCWSLPRTRQGARSGLHPAARRRTDAGTRQARHRQ